MIHSVIDSILSAIHMGNIGMLFPNSDKSYRQIRSTVLLKHVSSLIKHRCVIINLSTVIVAEEPRLSGYLNKMERVMAQILSLDRNSVSVSAKTNDSMGFIGKKEGIAAYSVCLLQRLSI